MKLSRKYIGFKQTPHTEGFMAKPPDELPAVLSLGLISQESCKGFKLNRYKWKCGQEVFDHLK